MLLQSTSSSCPSVLEAKPSPTPQWNSAYQVSNDRDTTQASDDAIWVKLHNLPHPYSFDEALLLCPDSPKTWVAWIPDYGEIVLNQADFYY